MIFRLIAIFMSLCLMCQTITLAEEPPFLLNIEGLSKTKAAQLFIHKKYRESLNEFKLLEMKHPKNLLIKRYIAALHDLLREWESATLKLLEILIENPDEMTARQMLAEVYVKKGSLSKAREQYQILIDKIPGTTAAISASYEIKKIDRMQAAPSSVKGERMAFEDFMQSEPTQLFTAGKYPQALRGFEKMLTKYPRDILIRRFHAITLSRLKKYDQAVTSFERALDIDPNNVATHFYLGETYYEMGEDEKARHEYRWVIEHDETSYQIRAKQAVFQTLQSSKKTEKPWSIGLSNRYEFDTNATYKSRDDNFSSAGDQNSSRYTTTLYGSYKVADLKRWSFTADGFYSQTLYNDFPNLRTYTPGLGFSGLFRFNLFKRPAFLNVREGISHTILRNKAYVFSNSISSNLIMFLHNKIRTTMSYRWSYNNYDASGILPDITARDGISQNVTFQNTFYLNDKKNFYIGAAYDFEDVSAEGTHSIKHAHGGRLIVHAPLIEKIEGDVVLQLKNSEYPKFAGPLKRNDTLASIRVQISRPLWEYLNIIASYQWEDVNARNNIYEYSKHVTGLELAYRY